MQLALKLFDLRRLVAAALYNVDETPSCWGTQVITAVGL